MKYLRWVLRPFVKTDLWLARKSGLSRIDALVVEREARQLDSLADLCARSGLPDQAVRLREAAVRDRRCAAELRGVPTSASSR